MIDLRSFLIGYQLGLVGGPIPIGEPVVPDTPIEPDVPIPVTIVSDNQDGTKEVVPNV